MPPSQAPSLRRHALLSVALAGALAACGPSAGGGDAGDAIATRDATSDAPDEHVVVVTVRVTPESGDVPVGRGTRFPVTISPR